MAAGQQSHYGNVYSPGLGATTFSGTTCRRSSGKPGGAARVQTMWYVEAVNRMAESQRETAGLALGRTTLHPGEYHEGIFVTDLVRRGSDVRFSVDFAGETHNFVFRIEEIAY